MNTRKIKASKDACLLGMSLPIYFWTKGFGRLIKTMQRLSKKTIILFQYWTALNSVETGWFSPGLKLIGYTPILISKFYPLMFVSQMELCNISKRNLDQFKYIWEDTRDNFE